MASKTDVDSSCRDVRFHALSWRKEVSLSIFEKQPQNKTPDLPRTSTHRMLSQIDWTQRVPVCKNMQMTREFLSRETMQGRRSWGPTGGRSHIAYS